MADELPTLRFSSKAAWRRWLAANHPSSSGIWMEIDKGRAGSSSVNYAEALEVALCYGWIDGQKAAAGDTTGRRQPIGPAARDESGGFTTST